MSVTFAYQYSHKLEAICAMPGVSPHPPTSRIPQPQWANQCMTADHTFFGNRLPWLWLPAGQDQPYASEY